MKVKSGLSPVGQPIGPPSSVIPVRSLMPKPYIAHVSVPKKDRQTDGKKNRADDGWDFFHGANHRRATTDASFADAISKHRGWLRSD